MSHPVCRSCWNPERKWSPFCCFAQLNQFRNLPPYHRRTRWMLVLSAPWHPSCPAPCQDVPCGNIGALTPTTPVFRMSTQAQCSQMLRGVCDWLWRLWCPHEGAAGCLQFNCWLLGCLLFPPVVSPPQLRHD